MDLLVVAAWEPELERLRSLLGPGEGAADARVMTAAVGIGLVDATAGTARAIFQLRPSHVVFVGTGGASPGSGMQIDDVIVASTVRLVDPTAVEGRAALPFAAEAVTLDGALVDLFFGAGARIARVVNTLGITTDDALAAKLGTLGDVEHLEAYGVARACDAAGIPCGVVLGIANVVGSQGREQWRARHTAASARAGELVYAAVRRSTTAPSPG